MTAQDPTNSSQTVRAERTEDEVVLRLPNPSRLLRAFLPEATISHLYAARRERLLALRSLIDAAIERTDAAERETVTKAPRRTEIRVE